MRISITFDPSPPPWLGVWEIIRVRRASQYAFIQLRDGGTTVPPLAATHLWRFEPIPLNRLPSALQQRLNPA